MCQKTQHFFHASTMNIYSQMCCVSLFARCGHSSHFGQMHHACRTSVWIFECNKYYRVVALIAMLQINKHSCFTFSRRQVLHFQILHRVEMFDVWLRFRYNKWIVQHRVHAFSFKCVVNSGKNGNQMRKSGRFDEAHYYRECECTHVTRTKD